MPKVGFNGAASKTCGKPSISHRSNAVSRFNGAASKTCGKRLLKALLRASTGFNGAASKTCGKLDHDRLKVPVTLLQWSRK